MRPKWIMATVVIGVAIAGTGLWHSLHGRERKTILQGRLQPNQSGSPTVFAPLSRNANPAPSGVAFSAGDLRDDRIYQRIEKLKSCGDPLSSDQCASLLALIRNPFPEVPGPRLAGIKNEVLHVLRGQRNLPAPWDETLADLFRDTNLPGVTRDYALQHLFTWYDELSRNASAADSNELAFARMDRVFWEATAAVDSEIAGTALVGLCSLSSNGTLRDQDTSEIGEAALLVLENKNADSLSRLSSLQVCSSLGITEALPIASQLATNPGPMGLRSSAIAALGELGGRSEIELLKALPGGEDGAFAPSIEHAITKLISRTQASHL